MLLLSGHSLTPQRRVPLEALSLRLGERDSTGNMTPVTIDGIGIDSWLKTDTEPGAGIVWRVRSIQTAYTTNTPTVQLEHVISCLKDRVLFGEYDSQAIGGASTVTAEQAIRFVLGKQSDWKLGACEVTDRMPYKFDGETLFDAIANVTKTLDGAWWDLDTTAYPFTLNIRKKPSAAACELRPGRNLSAISRTVDTSGMYTRFYPIGKDDLHLPNKYVSSNEAAYGVREKIETDQELTTTAELTNWANERLRKHAHPVVTTTAEGVELADATGESLDRLKLGRVCRIPLPEFGTTIEEMITRLEYTDALRNPEKVRITMSNQQEDRDILHLIAEEMKTGGGRGGKGSRTSSKKGRQDNAWFEDTNEHVAMCARGIIGTDANGKVNWERLSRLQVDKDGIYGEVKGVQGNVTYAYSLINANEEAIKAEVNKRVEDDKYLSGLIDVEAGKVAMVVGEKNGRKFIKAGEIAIAINQAGQSEALIDADKIRLTGATTIADVMTISQNSVVMKKPLRVDGQNVMAASLTLRSGGSSATINETDLSGMIRRAWLTDNDTVLHLRPVIGTDITFSKAVTGMDWSRSGGTITATPQPQGGPDFTYSLTARRNAAYDLTFLAAPDSLTTRPSTLYYRQNGNYYSLGSGYWYRRDSYQQTTTYYV
jgi:phage minor structural protein